MSRFGLGFTGAYREGNDSFTKILLHMDGSNGGTTFTDDNLGGSAHTWTATSATTTTAAQKFGTAALNCGAAVGYITTPDHADFTLGSGDFTVDLWFNVQGGAATNRRLFGHMDSNTTFASYAQVDSLNRMTWLAQIGGVNRIVNGTSTFTTSGWHHFAGVRTGNILRMFIDGVQEGGDVACSGTAIDSTASYIVGAGFGPFPFYGYIDEFRLSVGVARWTANFTPPTSQYG